MSRLARYVRDCRTFPADARIAWSNEGWRGVWEAIATRTLRKVLRSDRMILFAQGLDDLPEACSLDGVSVTRLQPRELPDAGLSGEPAGPRRLPGAAGRRPDRGRRLARRARGGLRLDGRAACDRT